MSGLLVKTPIGAHGRATIAQPQSDFSVVLGMPSGQATRTGKISNGAHIDDARAFYKRFRDDGILL
jgi:hypothetical protein